MLISTNLGDLGIVLCVCKIKPFNFMLRKVIYLNLISVLGCAHCWRYVLGRICQPVDT